jgi:hypothetical protein
MPEGEAKIEENDRVPTDMSAKRDCVTQTKSEFAQSAEVSYRETI